MERVDLIIIGSGQGGSALATAMAREGHQVLLFERDRLGGCCLHYGCYPSKGFLASAHAAGAVRHAADLGVQLTARADFAEVMHRVRRLSTGEWISRSFERWGVKVIFAEASFAATRVVSGGGFMAEAPAVVIDTGNSPAVPPIPGLSGTPFLTYKNFWQLTALPRRFLIIGGGFIGVELGQGLARLGSQVHIVETADRLMAREDPDVSEALLGALGADGCRLHLGTAVTAVAFSSGEFRLSLNGGEPLAGDALLVATGQRPNTRALNAAVSGIELDQRGYVKVDMKLETTCQGVYALGDVTGEPAFTHVSWEDHRRLMDILAGGNRRKMDRVLGYGVFTDPEVGRAGLTLGQARELGLDARQVTLPLSQNSRAYLTGRSDGFFRLLVDRGDGRILGATIVCPHAAELVHVFIDLMESRQTWYRLADCVHIHPTLAEALPSLARLLEREEA